MAFMRWNKDRTGFFTFIRSLLHPHHFLNFENVNKRMGATVEFSTCGAARGEFLQVILDNNRRQQG